ncbi:MAG: PLP-dependent aspartate aminotransferase family protein [Arenicellales bacterium]
MSDKNKPETLAAQALGQIDPETGALVPPIHVSTTFARLPDYSLVDGRSYIRDHGPTQEQVESVLCELEGGADAISFSSGLAACTAAFHALNAGDHVLVSDTIYHGVLSWLKQFAGARGLEYAFFATGNIEQFEDLIRPNQTKLVWLETPANPTWAITDIAAFCEVAHRHDVYVAVDSTCATPVLSQPIKLGADLVCHSATKYLNGHSDVLAGMLVTAKKDVMWERIRQHRLLAGSTLGSLEAFLLMRGMRTLFVRVHKQCENAMALAQFLEAHHAVEKVHYPGLASDPGHQVACRQMSGGFGGMLSILVSGDRQYAIATACKAKVFKRATSLGGVESVLEHRKTSEGDLTNTPENLIRISVGIEHVDDLLGDLKQMLDGG